MESSFRIISLCVLNLLLIVSGKPARNTLPKVAQCQSCHLLKDDKINVHLVPHSHDDVGWLKTVNQYYYGSHKYTQNAGVNYIISSSVKALLGHPQRRFIQVETAFFWKWWQEQDEELQNSVRELLRSGRLEMVNGAWSMNDEAATHYMSTVDQFTWGLRILNDTLGECAIPKIGWQIDPFGHSREHASLLTQMGFQGLVVGRIDYRDKARRIKDKALDFLWKSSVNLDNSKIFTTTFPDFYLSPKGLCFDMLCSDGPIIDEQSDPEYNLDKFVSNLGSTLDSYKDYYKTPNILIPMGGDFNYQAAEINFSSMDRLIKGFQNDTRYNVFYSTPSCYVAAVNKAVHKSQIALEEKNDDFFPYASEKHAYWTGYFTSRPASKRFERFANNILQVVKQLAAISKVLGRDFDNDLVRLREALGIMQHHDAITGTEKQQVADDYHKILYEGIEQAQKPLGTILGDLLKKDGYSDVVVNVEHCMLANVSICEGSTKDSFMVYVYNPLSSAASQYIRLPVEGYSFQITGPSEGKIEYDVFDTLNDFKFLNTNQTTSKNLVFLAKDIPPFGIQVYYIEKTTSEQEYESAQYLDDEHFGNEYNGFSIDNSTGRLRSVNINGVTLNITQEFFYYNGYSGYPRPSGAYIFRPASEVVSPFATKPIEVTVKRGKLSDEVQQIFNEEITQIVRVYKDKSDCYIEFDWIIGDLQLNGKPKEVITRFTVSDFNNSGTFYTDSNGRELIQRKLNTRNDYEHNSTDEPITSNYYPVTSRILMRDEDRNLEVTILNDRAQGGSSLKDGQIELMLHRRLLRDDGFGVGESLNEVQHGKGLFIRGQHLLTFGTVGNATTLFNKLLAQKMLLKPLLLVGGVSHTLEEIQKVINMKYQGIRKNLPPNVTILTLEPWKEDTLLLRLEHFIEKSEHEELSKPISFNIRELFTDFEISEIGETTLAANQWIDDYDNEEKLSWNGEHFQKQSRLNPDEALFIELKPMQIRTFLIKVVPI